LIFVLSTIVDAQVLAMLLKVILVNFNESIFKDISDYYNYTYDDDDCFILSWQNVGIFLLSPAIKEERII